MISYQEGEEGSLGGRRNICNCLSSLGSNSLGQAGHLIAYHLNRNLLTVNSQQSNLKKNRVVTFPRKPVRGFSLRGELGAEVFVLLRPPRLHNHYEVGGHGDIDEVDVEEVDGEDGEQDADLPNCQKYPPSAPSDGS